MQRGGVQRAARRRAVERGKGKRAHLGDGDGALGGAWLRRRFGESEGEIVARRGNVGEETARRAEKLRNGRIGEDVQRLARSWAHLSVRDGRKTGVLACGPHWAAAAAEGVLGASTRGRARGRGRRGRRGWAGAGQKRGGRAGPSGWERGEEGGWGGPPNGPGKERGANFYFSFSFSFSFCFSYYFSLTLCENH
jgi:hypothetical protein